MDWPQRTLQKGDSKANTIHLSKHQPKAHRNVKEVDPALGLSKWNPQQNYRKILPATSTGCLLEALVCTQNPPIDTPWMLVENKSPKVRLHHIHSLEKEKAPQKLFKKPFKITRSKRKTNKNTKNRKKTQRKP